MTEVPPPLLSRYQPPPGVFDEFVDGSGQVRPHWRLFSRELHALGAHELARRWEQAKRRLYENGVAYNIHAAGQVAERPWELDPLPTLVAPEDWTRLSTGLIQRARLLNAILADIYGRQRLLHENLLPPELVLANPSFLRRLHGAAVPRSVYLHLYAVDVGRSAGGEWWVVGDRTQAPTGAGYALENRLIVSQVLPHVFRDAHVQRLAPYFVALRDTLHHLAPAHRDNPRIVLLTAGPRGDTYFEDAYLSRYLGYTLVEGEDLSVRDAGVFMKTLAGLLPVDVILRRLPDDDCDPLELRSDSQSGVPGLTQAMRQGQVAVANALGSGLLETPAFLAFLQPLCRALLGEELQIPSIATWWCGQESEQRRVLENLDELIVRPAIPGTGLKSVCAASLTRDERSELARMIRARPGLFIAQEKFPHSSTPVWSLQDPTPRHLSLRLFLSAAGDSWTAMHGGLARLSSDAEPTCSSRQAQGTKDVWVLADGPVSSVSLLRQTAQATTIRRSGSELPSRVADNLFWLGRHVERAEGGARLLRAILLRLTSEMDAGSLPEMPALMRCLADQGQIEPGFVVEGIREQLPAIEQVLPVAIFDEAQPGSLRSTLNALDRTGSIVRDRLSVDLWRILRQIDQDFVRPDPRTPVEFGDALAMVNELLIDLAAFSGLAVESMTRTQGWRFLDMGRRIERSLHTISLLRSALVWVTPHESPLLEALLEVADSSMTYRSRYLANLQVAPVIDLLVTDATNPRSLAFQLEVLADHVEQLPREPTPFHTAEQKIMMSALNTLRLAEVDALATLDGGMRPQLDRLLARLATQVPELAHVLTKTYLIHAGMTRQLPRAVRTE